MSRLKITGLKARLAPLLDPSSWLLALVGFGLLAALDWATALTLLQWSLFALVIAALTIVVSRISFPQIKLSEFVARAKEGDQPAAVVVASVLIYCALVFVGIALWAK